jgi:hypothetical protein
MLLQCCIRLSTVPLAVNSMGGRRALPLARWQRVACYVIVAVAVAVTVAIVTIAIITASATRIFRRRKFLY